MQGKQGRQPVLIAPTSEYDKVPKLLTKGEFPQSTSKAGKLVAQDDVYNLQVQGKQAIDLFLKEGMSTREAIRIAFGVDAAEEDRATSYFMNILKEPNLRSYYEAVVAELNEAGEERSLWNRTLAETTLLKLINKAEEEMYEEGKPLTMTRVTAIVTAVKELNMLEGLITQKHEVKQAVVHFYGEENMLD